jgi:hypothetical protein
MYRIPGSILEEMRRNREPLPEERQAEIRIVFADVIHDQEQQRLVEDFIKGPHGGERAAAIIESARQRKRPLDNQDYVMQMVTTFTALVNELKEVSGSITRLDLEFILRNDKPFLSLVNMVGAEEKGAGTLWEFTERVWMQLTEAERNRIVFANRANGDISRSAYARKLNTVIMENVEGKPEENYIGLDWDDKFAKNRDFLKPKFSVGSMFEANRITSEKTQELLDCIKANRMEMCDVIAARFAQDTEFQHEITNRVFGR